MLIKILLFLYLTSQLVVTIVADELEAVAVADELDSSRLYNVLRLNYVWINPIYIDLVTGQLSSNNSCG